AATAAGGGGAASTSAGGAGGAAGTAYKVRVFQDITRYLGASGSGQAGIGGNVNVSNERLFIQETAASGAFGSAINAPAAGLRACGGGAAGGASCSGTAGGAGGGGGAGAGNTSGG